MKGNLILFFILCSIVVKAQDKALAYIATYKDIAISEMQRTGVPAAITLAQGLVESGCGEGDLCKRSNNHFGIKCKNDWVGERVYHDDDTKSECFRSYSNGMDSYKDHSDFLKNRPPYSSLFKLDPVDYESWAKGLKKAGYATEKDYPQKLIKVINDYNLNQFSLIALHRTIDDSKNVIASIDSKNIQSRGINLRDSITSDSSITHSDIKDTILGELIIPVSKSKETKQIVFTPSEVKEDSVTFINTNYKDTISNESSLVHYPSGVFVINHSKVTFVKEGTSLLAIANQYNIALAKLLEYNDLVDDDVTTISQLIYLEPKQIKGLNETHVVGKNETLTMISQVEGVRLERILVYNKLKKNSILKTGDKILLHPPVIMRSVVTKKPV